MKLKYISTMLGGKIADEITRITVSGGGFGLSEIRIRRDGLSTLLINGETIRLSVRVGRGEIEEVVKKILGGALYAHRDSISQGYVSLEYGIRVGVCGRAAYDGGRLVGVSDVTSLVFRIPTGRCAFGTELYGVFLRGIGSGLLIYSLPGVGKTTALRSLARSAGKDRRVAVVDERCEFLLSEYFDRQVDILRGYHRKEGIEIATRTLSPDVIVVDELSGGEAIEVSEVVRCGIPIVATAHASSVEEIRAKPSLRSLIECGAFSVACGISRKADKYTLRTDNL